jgi:hypothetical protein
LGKVQVPLVINLLIFLLKMMNILDAPVLKSSTKPPPYGGKPKFVKFGPGDTGKFMPHVFYEGASTYIKLPLCSNPL